MAENWLVLKFGGTSVSGGRQWETLASLAAERRAEGYRVLLVCSAAAGVTNHLTRLADDPADAGLLREIIQTHRDLADELEVDASVILDEATALMHTATDLLLDDGGSQARAQLLCMGEWLSTRIGAEYLARRLDVAWVDARDALEIKTEADLSPARRWLSAACEPGPDPDLAARWAALSPVVITQGYVARTADGATALLGRGGSDTSAALLAGRLAAQRLEIWTDVPGLFSADPRIFGQARLLRELDYAEALEMAASGAKVVQSRCIRAAAATATPIQIRDTSRPGMAGTRITAGAALTEGVKAITCQTGMAVLLLQNLDTRHEVGFLAAVFDIFRRRGISIDLVATSETTTTVAINCLANHLAAGDLSELTRDLEARCRVRLYGDCVCVNLVGRGVRKALADLQDTMRYFDRHPLLMLSQSANDLCLSILVKQGDHAPLLEAAHAALIPADPGLTGSTFGPCWNELRAHDG